MLLGGCHVFMPAQTSIYEGVNEPDMIPEERRQPIQATAAPLAAEHLGTPRARLEGVMLGEGTWESVPAQVDPSFAVDRATLEVTSPETCVQLDLQTEAPYDMPIADLEIECEVDHEPVPARLEFERAGEVHAWYEVRVDFEKIDRDYHVITRHARLCCPKPARRMVELRLFNEQAASKAGERWRLWFRWALAP